MKCPNCGDEFKPNHGNRDYCCYACQTAFNNTKQRENNTIVKALSKGFLGNYKLFLKLLPNLGRMQIRVILLLKTGFDQDGYYGTLVDTEGMYWHKVNEYLFTISKASDGDLILHLIKK